MQWKTISCAILDVFEISNYPKRSLISVLDSGLAPQEHGKRICMDKGACACACARTLGALDPTVDPNPRALPNHPAPPPPPNQTTHPPTTTTTQSNQESTSIGHAVKQCLPAGVGVQRPEYCTHHHPYKKYIFTCVNICMHKTCLSECITDPQTMYKYVWL